MVQIGDQSEVERSAVEGGAAPPSTEVAVKEVGNKERQGGSERERARWRRGVEGQRELGPEPVIGQPRE